jgi:hypothetical protein
MLEFAKVYNHDEDKSMTSAEIKTFFAITQDGMTIIASRVIFMKAKRLVFTIDGTVGALARKVNDTVKMSNEDFAMFSDIQFASEVPNAI